MRLLAIAFAMVASIVLGACSPPTTEVSAPFLTQQESYIMAPVDNSGSDVIRSCNRKDGSGVLMSFDDSGTPEQVSAILDRLAQHEAQAAFFPTGEWALEHLDLVERMRQDGHIVGSHTHSHARLGELSTNNPDEFYAEIYPLENVTNTDPMWLRPPYEDGAYDEMVAERLTEKDVQLCTWTVDTHDWSGDTVDKMMARLTRGDEFSPQPLGEDSVILMHLQGEYTVELIDAIMAHLDQSGLEVAPLPKK